MHEPAARQREIGFHRVEFPVGLRQRPGVATEDSSLIQQAGLFDSVIHAF